MTRPRLTQHQREVLDDITRLSARNRFGEVDANLVGSIGACAHLMEKGYIEIARTETGPHGGLVTFYRLTNQDERTKP